MKTNNNTIRIGKNGKEILAEMTVAAPAERVWQILTSFEEMPAHLRGLKDSRILKRKGSYRLVEQTARVETPLLPLSFRLVMDVLEERPFLYFNQSLGSFGRFSGHWKIDPSIPRNGTRVSYYLEASLGRGLRGRAVEQQLHRMIRQNLQDLAIWIDNSET